MPSLWRNSPHSLTDDVPFVKKIKVSVEETIPGNVNVYLFLPCDIDDRSKGNESAEESMGNA
jgi:hypothetical protein